MTELMVVNDSILIKLDDNCKNAYNCFTEILKESAIKRLSSCVPIFSQKICTEFRICTQKFFMLLFK